MLNDSVDPDSSGQVYVTTVGGIRCAISEAELCCQNDYFTETPMINGHRSNGVRISTTGQLSWVVGDLGDIPVVELSADRPYDVLGWTLSTTTDGNELHITHPATSQHLRIDHRGLAADTT